MSSLLVFAAALLGGMVGGGIVASSARITGSLARARGWVRRYRGWNAPTQISDADCEAVATEFAHHATVVRGQVAAFGDELAGEDAGLRERLRLFEQSPGEGWLS
jgi:hypothetical protein